MQKPLVMIVEDDFMIADCLEEILVAAGFSVCGIARTTAQAIALAERYKPDLGVIDLRLADGDLGTDVAAALCSCKRFGVLYVSGNPDHPLLETAEGDACIAKPYTAKGIVAALQVVAEKVSNSPLSPFPPGFRLLEKSIA